MPDILQQVESNKDDSTDTGLLKDEDNNVKEPAFNENNVLYTTNM